MTPLCTTICRPELQRQYDMAGNIRTLADMTGINRNVVYQYIRRLRIKTHKRGGVYGRTWEQRAAHYAENRENGDKSLRARPCKHLPCRQQRTDGHGCVLVCAYTTESECVECRRGYALELEAVCAVRGGSLEQTRESGTESVCGERM